MLGIEQVTFEMANELLKRESPVIVNEPGAGSGGARIFFNWALLKGLYRIAFEYLLTAFRVLRWP